MSFYTVQSEHNVETQKNEDHIYFLNSCQIVQTLEVCVIVFTW